MFGFFFHLFFVCFVAGGGVCLGFSGLCLFVFSSVRNTT